MMEEAVIWGETEVMTTECKACGGTGWVCEDHETKPWDGREYQ